MNQIQHEAKRLLRFEQGQVNSLSDAGRPDMQTANRGYPRAETATTLPDNLNYEQRTVVLSGGDQDYPVTIGLSPFVM